MSMRLLITGGSGFMGTNLVEASMRESWPTLNVDVRPPQSPRQRDVWARVDILDQPQLLETVRSFSPDAVVHLAARTDLAETRDTAAYAANTVGVANVIEAIVRARVPRAIFASSRLVCAIGYEPTHDLDVWPTTAYGRSKAFGEMLVRTDRRLDETAWTIVRPTSIWGPWFGEPYFRFFAAVRSGWYLHPAGVKPRKSFGYIDNSIYQILTLLRAKADAVSGRTFWLADYDPLEVRSWAREIAEVFGVRRPWEVPSIVLRVAAKSGDVLSAAGLRRIPLTTFRLDNLVSDMVYDTSPLEALVGPLPATRLRGVQATVAWMRTVPS